MARLDPSTVLKTIQKIDYKEDHIDEAKALVALAYLTRLNTKQLLSLKSNHFYITRKKIKIEIQDKKVEIPTKNLLAKIALKHIETVAPYTPLFTEFYSQRKNPQQRYDDKIHYYIKKWFLTTFKHITPRKLQQD